MIRESLGGGMGSRIHVVALSSILLLPVGKAWASVSQNPHPMPCGIVVDRSKGVLRDIPDIQPQDRLYLLKASIAGIKKDLRKDPDKRIEINQHWGEIHRELLQCRMLVPKAHWNPMGQQIMELAQAVRGNSDDLAKARDTVKPLPDSDRNRNADSLESAGTVLGDFSESAGDVDGVVTQSARSSGFKAKAPPNVRILPEPSETEKAIIEAIFPVIPLGREIGERAEEIYEKGMSMPMAYKVMTGIGAVLLGAMIKPMKLGRARKAAPPPVNREAPRLHVPARPKKTPEVRIRVAKPPKKDPSAQRVDRAVEGTLNDIIKTIEKPAKAGRPGSLTERLKDLENKQPDGLMDRLRQFDPD